MDNDTNSSANGPLLPESRICELYSEHALSEASAGELRFARAIEKEAIATFLVLQASKPNCEECEGRGEVETRIGMMACDACAGGCTTQAPSTKPLPCNYIESGDRREDFDMCTVCGDTRYGGSRTKCGEAISHLQKVGAIPTPIFTSQDPQK